MKYEPFKMKDIPDDVLNMFDETFERAPSSADILGVCLGVAKFLMEKNLAYGHSALDPVRVFSKADADEQIRVRMDDKLSRIARGDLAGEDAELDLLGYLVLMLVYRKQNG